LWAVARSRVELTRSRPTGPWLQHSLLGEDRRRGNVRGVEGKSVPASRERLEQLRHGLRAARGIKAHQSYGRPAAENRDHDRVVIDRIHENVVAVALMIKRVEFHFADAPGQFFCGGE